MTAGAPKVIVIPITTSARGTACMNVGARTVLRALTAGAMHSL